MSVNPALSHDVYCTVEYLSLLFIVGFY